MLQGGCGVVFGGFSKGDFESECFQDVRSTVSFS